MQHVTHPSNHDLDGTEISESNAENIQCAYTAVELSSLCTFLTWVGFEIGIDKALVISIDRPCHARPRLGNAERTRHIIALYNLSLQVQAQEG